MAAGEYLTVAEFGARLGFKRSGAYKLVRRERPQMINVGSRARPRLRIPATEVDRIAKRRLISHT